MSNVRLSVVAASVMVTLALSGCASVGAGAHLPKAASSSTPATDRFTAPDLGAKPAPAAPLTDAEAETAHLAEADREWADLVAVHPSAVRPAVALIAYDTGTPLFAASVQCMTQAGYHAALAPEGNGWESSGPTVESGDVPEDDATAYAVASYVCAVQHSSRPEPPYTPDELRYVYRYLDQYLVPCWTHYGFTVRTGAPGLDAYLASHGAWYPQRSGSGSISETEINTACPVRTPLRER
ncbi:hypothetical protein F1C58_13440 [Glaciihabitans sp. INWT7]|uniref:hypothetical protein n=1 Tax=Glaciihabitans sp. INWT7 TaxID=2596912 RepID=UPI0016274EB5|nr:hypothetical protein [Glaciihabitans sp. INWT7]QNE47799.1 hypothetical protein F1C58_13440 [Glaciihabitans sp. INWT7]